MWIPEELMRQRQAEMHRKAERARLAADAARGARPGHPTRTPRPRYLRLRSRMAFALHRLADRVQPAAPGPVRHH